MGALYFIIALVDSPFRGVVNMMLMFPLAILVFLLSLWLGSRHPQRASRCLRWSPLLCGLALVFVLTMDFLRPMRSLQDTMIQSQLGKLSKQQVSAEIDRHYTVKGLVLRGLLHYGPFTVLFFGSLGLYLGSSTQRQRDVLS